VDQAHAIAGAQGAMGAMIAHYYREATGKGQYVDTSTQESAVLSALTVPQAWDLQRFIWPREGAYMSRARKRVVISGLVKTVISRGDCSQAAWE